ncbi:MAG: capsule polysaccharide transporter [Gemmatimonadales bacterium]|nr:MAG: capsule polysaccharide transporter [Gemmatimonadales bacterium]
MLRGSPLPSLAVKTLICFTVLSAACLGWQPSGVAPLLAQQPPVQLPPGMTPQQALQVLRQQPELADLLRQRLRQSGLSAAEIRAMLRNAGYPEDLLDAYLAPETEPVPIPTESVLEAMSVLGVDPFTTTGSPAQLRDTVLLRARRDSIRAAAIARADSLAQAGGALQLFGLDVFRQTSTQFTPIVTGPVDDDYRLGPGDVLVLILTGAVEIAHSNLEVSRDGFIIIPRVGQIYVNNLTLGQLKEVLYDRLGRVYSGVTRGPEAKTKFEVTVARVRVNTVRVAGEVTLPGTYRIAATGGVLSAIYEAGGLTERGNFRAVEVRRGNQLIATLDLYDFLLHGSVSNDPPLASGDVIFVPVRGPRVKIAGEVTRPAIYEIKPGETLLDLLQLAGGLTPMASTQSATIDRILPPEERPDPGRARTVITVDLHRMLKGEIAPVALAAGDSVTIFSITSPRRNAVTIKGSVWQPGTYALEPGMRLWDLIRQAGGLRPETYRGRAQILRTFPDSTKQLIGVYLGEGDGSVNPADNPELVERDEVTVFARTDFIPERYVAVHGAVKRPGLIPFADSMTLRDAILLAGGLTDDAYLVQAEVSRLNPRGLAGGDTLVTILQVPLDSSYLLAADGYVARPVGEDAPRVTLHPYDNVFVRRQPGWGAQRNVVLSGEVRFPGTYSLLTKDERLASLLQRAGGLTPQAYPNGIQFFRTQNGIGRIPVDLPQVLRNPRHRDNLVLVAGDSIHIPQYIPTVRVEGAVNAPTAVPYAPGQGVGYYVAAAGGFARNADKGKTFVRQPNGSVEVKGRPQPGAVVVVPTRDVADRGYFVTLFSSLAQVIAATATIIVVLVRG